LKSPDPNAIQLRLSRAASARNRRLQRPVAPPAAPPRFRLARPIGPKLPGAPRASTQHLIQKGFP
ncbi:hypothetical protein, partial [Burkholderia sp. Cy-647]|uniref:hypothetical protein n=1 Tax=Burkholderia sp. Cy-647 TaxID=2608328 RepID=UPI0019639F88